MAQVLLCLGLELFGHPGWGQKAPVWVRLDHGSQDRFLYFICDDSPNDGADALFDFTSHLESVDSHNFCVEFHVPTL